MSNEIYIEDINKSYKLDGTEPITTITTYTPTVVNNTLTNGCGYLTSGFDNSTNWELTYKYKFVDDVQSTWVGAGALVCPANTSARDYFFIQQWVQSVNFRNPSSGVGASVNIPNFTRGTWYSMKIVKENTTITVFVDDVQLTQVQISTINNYSTLCVGLDKTVSSSISTIKDIKVKSL